MAYAESELEKQVDAFTESAFKGNPASVCFLEEEEERNLDLVDRRSHDMVVVIDGDWRNTCGTREEKATSEIEWG